MNNIKQNKNPNNKGIRLLCLLNKQNSRSLSGVNVPL